MNSLGKTQRRWADFVAMSAIVGLLLLLYHEVLRRMAFQWYLNPDYSHGFLVPILSAYFVWQRRDALAAIPISPSRWGGAVLAIGLLILFIGTIGAELYLQRISLLAVIAGLVLLILGRNHLRLHTFPIVFLIFMIPLPDLLVNAVAFPLQMLAARAAAFCLFILGIPVLREGNVITLANTTLEVAEACSGIRSLQALATLGAVYAYFTETIRWKQALLVMMTIPIAVAANALRVCGTGVLAHYYGAAAAEGFYHTFSGIVVFAVAFALLLLCGAILSRIKKQEHRSNSEGRIPS